MCSAVTMVASDTKLWNAQQEMKHHLITCCNSHVTHAQLTLARHHLLIVAAAAAAALTALTQAAKADAHDQDQPAVPALGVSHLHQLLTPQAHPLLCGCACVRPLAGLWLLPYCCH